MNNKFIELPVYEHPFRRNGSVSDQLINVDYIIRVYVSDSYEYRSDTFIETTRQFNLNEPLRIALEYSEVVNKINACVQHTIKY